MKIGKVFCLLSLSLAQETKSERKTLKSPLCRALPCVCGGRTALKFSKLTMSISK